MDFLLKSKSKWRIQDGRWFQFLIYIIDNVIMISPLVLKIMNVSANFLRHLSFYSKEPKSVTAFWFIHILSYRFNPTRSLLETVLDFWLVNVCMKECELGSLL